MATNRPTLKQLRDARNREAREEVQMAIAEGRMTVRQMTPRERKQADIHRAARVQEQSAGARARARR
jgi:hypothetical protein